MSIVQVKELLDDCQRADITIHPPCIDRSGWEFESYKDGSIQFGLGAGVVIADTDPGSEPRVPQVQGPGTPLVAVAHDGQ